MPDILLREVPEEVAKALSQMAQAAGKDRHTWIKDQLSLLASGPILRERYAIKFYNAANEGKGRITRRSNDLGGTTGTFANLNENEARAVEMATDRVRRNQQGDLAEAMWNLKNVFDNVFEEPV
jgi:hypothetical protein